MKLRNKNTKQAFTIIELLVVLVILGILVSLATFSYNDIFSGVRDSQRQTNLNIISGALEKYYDDKGEYPGCSAMTSANLTTLSNTLGNINKNAFTDPLADDGANSIICGDIQGGTTNIMAYNADSSADCQTGAYCLNFELKYREENTGEIRVVKSHRGWQTPYIQNINTASCTSTRIRVVDARDNHTYWIQKLADGKCWMLTNLGYAGGGADTYNDTKTLANGTGGSATYTVASYYVTPATTNFTTEPNDPSSSTDGTGQYGYLYNWCAATGAQLSSSGCSSVITTPLPVTTASICPSGWRLPTSNGGEFTALNTAINGGSTTTGAGLISSPWLAQRGGNWGIGFTNQGSGGYYWSSTQVNATVVYNLFFSSTNVNPANLNNKNNGFAVRCVAY